MRLDSGTSPAKTSDSDRRNARRIGKAFMTSNTLMWGARLARPTRLTCYDFVAHKFLAIFYHSVFFFFLKKSILIIKAITAK